VWPRSPSPAHRRFRAAPRYSSRSTRSGTYGSIPERAASFALAHALRCNRQAHAVQQLVALRHHAVVVDVRYIAGAEMLVEGRAHAFDAEGVQRAIRQVALRG